MGGSNLGVLGDTKGLRLPNYRRYHWSYQLMVAMPVSIAGIYKLLPIDSSYNLPTVLLLMTYCSHQLLGMHTSPTYKHPSAVSTRFVLCCL